MSKVFSLLALCVVLAIFRAAVLVLGAALMLALIYSFVARPRDTVVFLATCALSCVAVAKPFACVVGVTIIVVVLGLSGSRRRPASAERLPRLQ